jgi:hypothetical protein
MERDIQLLLILKIIHKQKLSATLFLEFFIIPQLGNSLNKYNKCFIFLQLGVLVSKLSGILYFDAGEVSEWLIEPVSKTGVFLTEHRGFESRPLRFFSFKFWLISD